MSAAVLVLVAGQAVAQDTPLISMRNVKLWSPWGGGAMVRGYNRDGTYSSDWIQTGTGLELKPTFGWPNKRLQLKDNSESPPRYVELDLSEMPWQVGGLVVGEVVVTVSQPSGNLQVTAVFFDAVSGDYQGQQSYTGAATISTTEPPLPPDADGDGIPDEMDPTPEPPSHWYSPIGPNAGETWMSRPGPPPTVVPPVMVLEVPGIGGDPNVRIWSGGYVKVDTERELRRRTGGVASPTVAERTEISLVWVPEGNPDLLMPMHLVASGSQRVTDYEGGGTTVYDMSGAQAWHQWVTPPADRPTLGYWKDLAYPVGGSFGSGEGTSVGTVYAGWPSLDPESGEGVGWAEPTGSGGFRSDIVGAYYVEFGTPPVGCVGHDSLTLDWDGDGIPNGRDQDIDGDGVLNIYDRHPCEFDGPCDPNSETQDTDGDGVENRWDDDVDGDGCPDHMDPDPCNPDVRSAACDPPPPPDPDGGGGGPGTPPLPDSDGDGIPNVNDPDHPDYNPEHPGSDADGDGTPNRNDPNHPEYQPNHPDSDPDGDGVPNRLDPDDDGDGIPDIADPDHPNWDPNRPPEIDDPTKPPIDPPEDPDHPPAPETDPVPVLDDECCVAIIEAIKEGTRHFDQWWEEVFNAHAEYVEASWDALLWNEDGWFAQWRLHAKNETVAFQYMMDALHELVSITRQESGDVPIVAWDSPSGNEVGLMGAVFGDDGIALPASPIEIPTAEELGWVSPAAKGGPPPSVSFTVPAFDLLGHHGTPEITFTVNPVEWQTWRDLLWVVVIGLEALWGLGVWWEELRRS